MDASAAFNAELQSRVDRLGASAKAQIQATTGVDVSNARVQQGATSTLALIKGGYNPDSEADSENLIHAIAGGLALVPGPGWILAGAVEGLWQLGHVVACPLENAFASIGLGQPSPACGGKACTSSGNWTAAGILRAAALPALPRGSFAALAFPALATYAAKAANCKAGMPPDIVIDALVSIWNHTHAGPPVPIFVPSLAEQIGGNAGSPMLTIGQGERVTGTTPYARAGLDPSIYYAFQPVSAIEGSGYAQSRWVRGQSLWNPFPSSMTTIGSWYTSPRVVSINGGAVLPETQHTISLHLGPPAGPSPAVTSAVDALAAQFVRIAQAHDAALAPKPSGASTGAVVGVIGAVAAAGVGAAWYIHTKRRRR